MPYLNENDLAEEVNLDDIDEPIVVISLAPHSNKNYH